MKSLPRVMIIVVGLTAFAGWQHLHLQNLTRKHTDLQEQLKRKTLSSKSSSTLSTTTSPIEKFSPTELHHFWNQVEDTYRPYPTSQDRSISQQARTQSIHQLLRLTEQLSSDQIGEVIENLQNSEGDPDRTKLLDQFLFDVLTPIHPFAVFDFLLNKPDWIERQASLQHCFHQCRRMDPRRALQLYKEQISKTPSLDTPSIRRNVLLALAEIDPSQMVDRIARENFVSDPNYLSRGFAQELFDQLPRPRDCAACLLAIRQAQKEHPDSLALAQVQTDLADQISMRVWEWSYQDIELFIDSGFTHTQKLQLFKEVENQGGLTEKNQWATRMLDVNLEQWKETIRTGSHPLPGFLMTWAVFSDREAAQDFVTQIPPGAMRDHVLANTNDLFSESSLEP